MERALGARRYLALYLLSGVGAGAVALVLARAGLIAEFRPRWRCSCALAYAALHAEDYALVGPPGLRLRGPLDATSLTLVDASSALPLFRYLLDAMPDAAPWPFAGIEYMGGIAAIRYRVLHGADRIVVLPRYFIRADLAAGRLRPLMPRVRPRSDAFRLLRRPAHPRAKELIGLAEELREILLR